MSVHLIDTFDRGVVANPDGLCFRMADGSVQYTYREVQDLSHRIAAALHDHDVGDDGKIAVLSPNDPIAFVCILGGLRAGAAWVPLNTRAPADSLISLLDLTDCEALFYHSSLKEMAGQIVDGVPGIRVRVAIGGGEGLDGDPQLEDWMAPEGATVPQPEFDAGDTAILFPTGGTTGKSKAVQITHRMAAYMNLAFAAHMAEPEPPVMAMAAPMTHAAGPICFPVFAQGGTIVVHDGVQPQKLLRSIQDHQVTRMFLPPTAIYSLLAQPDVREYDYSSLRHFIYAAAPMSTAKLKEAIDVFGPVMTQTFGQAESPMIVTFLGPKEHEEAVGDPAKERRLASCGRASLVAEVGIMDDDGNLLGPEGQGEIVVRGELPMQGYYKDEERTEETRRPAGWHGTSDIGLKDSDGFVYIVDRKRDMIITGGFNVWPGEIEQVIHSRPEVNDCAVIGLPDEQWGESVTAVVELKDGEESDADEIRALVKERLGSVKTPKSVIFRDLPRSPVGKVLKKDLREEYWTEAGRSI